MGGCGEKEQRLVGGGQGGENNVKSELRREKRRENIFSGIKAIERSEDQEKNGLLEPLSPMSLSILHSLTSFPNFIRV